MVFARKNSRSCARRERKIAVASVMVLVRDLSRAVWSPFGGWGTSGQVEEHCRGLWTEDLLQTVEVLMWL